MSNIENTQIADDDYGFEHVWALPEFKNYHPIINSRTAKVVFDDRFKEVKNKYAGTIQEIAIQILIGVIKDLVYELIDFYKKKHDKKFNEDDNWIIIENED
jgi:hypothetical protein